MFLITKVRVYAIVDAYGGITCVSKELPIMKDNEYAVPMTLTLGHNWVEGVVAWLANLEGEVRSYL